MAEILWKRAEEKLFISKENFLENLADCELEGLDVGGELSYVIIRKGPEFHFECIKSKPLSIKIIAEALRKQFEEYGYVTTRTPKQMARQRRINELIGFRMTGEDPMDIHYRVDELRRHGCRS